MSVSWNGRVGVTTTSQAPPPHPPTRHHPLRGVGHDPHARPPFARSPPRGGAHRRAGHAGAVRRVGPQFRAVLGGATVRRPEPEAEREPGHQAEPATGGRGVPGRVHLRRGRHRGRPGEPHPRAQLGPQQVRLRGGGRHGSAVQRLRDVAGVGVQLERHHRQPACRAAHLGYGIEQRVRPRAASRRGLSQLPDGRPHRHLPGQELQFHLPRSARLLPGVPGPARRPHHGAVVPPLGPGQLGPEQRCELFRESGGGGPVPHPPPAAGRTPELPAGAAERRRHVHRRRAEHDLHSRGAAQRQLLDGRRRAGAAVAGAELQGDGRPAGTRPEQPGEPERVGQRPPGGPGRRERAPAAHVEHGVRPVGGEPDRADVHRVDVERRVARPRSHPLAGGGHPASGRLPPGLLPVRDDAGRAVEQRPVAAGLLPARPGRADRVRDGGRGDAAATRRTDPVPHLPEQPVPGHGRRDDGEEPVSPVALQPVPARPRPRRQHRDEQGVRAGRRGGTHRPLLRPEGAAPQTEYAAAAPTAMADHFFRATTTPFSVSQEMPTTRIYTGPTAAQVANSARST